MFNIDTDFLGLDFDGVIVDSIGECLLTGYNAFNEIFNPQDLILDINQIDIELINQAKFLRNFIRSGEDYIYIFLALEKNVKIQSQSQFDHFRNLNINYKETFFEKFYQTRSLLLTNYLDEWMKLNPLFEGMEHYLSAMADSGRLTIISTKKKEFIKDILEFNEIQIDEKKIFTSRDKDQTVLSIMNQHNIQPESFYFVDDQIDTLLKMKYLNVNLLFAEWGYNNQLQKQIAEDNEISILTLSGFLNHSF